MGIELLYFDGCPNWQPGLENLKSALQEAHLDAQVQLVKIEDVEQAKRERFLGSPSIRVDGVDLWPEERDEYLMECRVYQTPQGMKGSPTVEMIRQKLANVLSQKAGEA